MASFLAPVPGITGAAKADTAQAKAKTKTDAGGIDMQREMNANHYYVALGPVLTSDYEGSNDYEVQPLLIARWIRAGAYVAFEGNTLSANVIPMSLFQAGPMLSWHRARKSVDDHRVDRMRDISGALEGGGFVGAMLRDPNRPERRLGLKVEFLQDVSGSYDGNHTVLKLEGGLPLGETWSIDGEVFSGYGNGRYMDTYFSVDADNAARSGLSQFDAKAGFKDVGLHMMLSHQFTDHWGIGMIGTYKRMLGDAANSPVVAEAGSRDQFVGGLVGTWRY